MLLSCLKKKEYINIPENIRNSSLYYTYNTGDTFNLLLNNNDTLTFVVESKNTGYNIHAGKRNIYYENFNIYCSSVKGSIDYEIINYPFALFSTIVLNEKPRIQDLYNQNLFQKIDTLTIDNKLYYNVYNLGNLIISREKGIIKYWNDTLTLSIIE